VKADPLERVPWKALLASLVNRSLWDEAIAVGEGAVFVDVRSAEIHALYGLALGMKGRTKNAEFEFESGLLAKSNPQEEAQVRVSRAKVLIKEQQTKQARTELDLALKADPKNADAIKLRSALK
jgi:cellulose synthase operon protein C